MRKGPDVFTVLITFCLTHIHTHVPTFIVGILPCKNINISLFSLCLCIVPFIYWSTVIYGLPLWLSGKEYACQWRSFRRCGFNPWVDKIPWRRKWQPISVFLPGKSRGQRSLVGYSPWGRKRFKHDEPLNNNNCDIYYLIRYS